MIMILAVLLIIETAILLRIKMTMMLMMTAIMTKIIMIMLMIAIKRIMNITTKERPDN